MRYMGGKSRIAESVAYVAQQLAGGRPIVEPFMGAGWATAALQPAVALDANPWLITLFKALQKGWQPPDEVSREQYEYLKAMKPDIPLTAFVGFGCSFGGIWFKAYASGCRPGRNFAAGAKKSLMKRFTRFANCEFLCSDYRNLSPSGALVYCDPPYRGTDPYYAVGRFDSDAFFETCRRWAKTNTVLVSEYAAPPDFECVWEHEVKSDLQHPSKQTKSVRYERMFVIGEEKK